MGVCKAMHLVCQKFTRVFFVIFIISIATGVYSQVPENIDSLLENKYAFMPDDSVKVIELYNKGFDARTKDIHTAFAYARACEEAANNSTNPFLIAKANNLLGVLYFRTGKLEKALAHHSKALALREKINDKEGMAYSKLNIANVYSDLNKKADAEKYYLQALQQFNEIGNLKLKANTLNNIGILKFEAEEYNAAKKYFIQSLQIGDQLNDYELKAFCYNNLGTLFEAEKNFKEAQAYYEDALELHELMGNEVDIIDSYNNIASVAFELNDIKKAKQILLKIKPISEQNEYAEGNLSIYNFLKDVYVVEKKFDSAMYYQTLYYQAKEKMNESGEDEIKTLVSDDNFAENKQIVDNLKKENYTLKYLIGVLIVFLIMAGLLLFKGNKHE